MGNGKATIGRRWRTDRMSQRCSNLEVTMEYNPCSCGHITNTCWDTYFTYWDSGREVLNAQNEMLGELWSPSRLPLSMMAGPFCGTTKTLVGRQLEFSEWQWFFADPPSTGLWGMAMEGCQMMTPKIPNKGCSLRQGSGGIGGKKKVRRVTAQSPLQQERPDFCKQRHKRGGVGRNNRGVLNVSGNGMWGFTADVSFLE